MGEGQWGEEVGKGAEKNVYLNKNNEKEIYWPCKELLWKDSDFISFFVKTHNILVTWFLLFGHTKT